MALVSHEVPLLMLEESRYFNDYDYCLIHHYIKYPEYRNFFRESAKRNRFIILDNSVVELGESSDLSTYLEVASELEPDVVIAPDNFKEPEKNFSLFKNFIEVYTGDPKTIMGVPHGNSLEEYIADYKRMSEIASWIGISVHRFMNRFQLIEYLLKEDIIEKNINHHLLGCFLPQEFKYYDFFNKHRFIKSIDTSNPVIHGIYRMQYDDKKGLNLKLPMNIDTVIESPVITTREKKIIYHNIFTFKEFVNEYHTNI